MKAGTGKWWNGWPGCRVASVPCKAKQTTSSAAHLRKSNMLSSGIRLKYFPSPWLTLLLTDLAKTKRLYQVLETRLKSQDSINHTAAGTKASTAGGDKGIGHGDGPWIVGDKFTIADIACFSWINWAEWAGVDLKAFP